MKKTYYVYGTVVGTKLIGKFEAEYEEDAKEMAWESDEVFVSLCSQCADECDDAQVTDVFVGQVVEERE